MNIMKKNITAIVLTCSAIGFALQVSAQQTTGFKVLRNLAIASPGGWDCITVDGADKRIYTSHGNQVNVLSTVTGDSVGYVPNTPGVHGIALIPALNKGFISAGRTNKIVVFD